MPFIPTKMQLIVLGITVVVVYCTTLTGATICQPNSFFKIDCNKCMCSDDGTKYSCTNLICRQPPKYMFDDQDYILSNKKSRPYLNDEIASEENDGRYQNDIADSLMDDNEEGKRYDENNDESEEEINSNEDYKYRKDINF